MPKYIQVATPIKTGLLSDYSVTTPKIARQTSGTVLKGKGAGADVAFEAESLATKEFFKSATNGTESYQSNLHAGYRIDADLEYAVIEFYAPSDFSSIQTVEVIWEALGAVTNMVLTLRTCYGAKGENICQHGGAGTTVNCTTTTTSNIIYGCDLSSLLTLLAAGDYVGVYVRRETGGNFNGNIMGVRVKYS